jgi:galactokinase
MLSPHPRNHHERLDIDERQVFLAREFEQRFGGAPALWVRAPGRVDLMGSHTDYNLGYVMTMTLDRDTWLVLRPRRDRHVAVQSLNLPGGSQFSLDRIEHDRQVAWSNYVRGMAWVMEEAGFRLNGFDALIHSTIPFASGLSSSAAIEMAAGVAFEATSGLDLDPVRLAILGQRAENRFVGVNCGILDQYSSALGEADSAVLLDCRDLCHTIAPIAPGIAVVICDTCAPRNLAGTEYGERRAQCEEGAAILGRHYPHVRALRDATCEMLDRHRDEMSPVVERRCRFIVEEDERVLALAGALTAGNRPQLGRVFAESYAGARDLYEIGAPSMEAMMEAMLNAPGVIAARQAGGGFGGCMVALVEQEQVETFSAAVKERYRAATSIEPHVYNVRPSQGAGLLAPS